MRIAIGIVFDTFYLPHHIELVSLEVNSSVESFLACPSMADRDDTRRVPSRIFGQDVAERSVGFLMGE
jgi:hypothetical protein